MVAEHQLHAPAAAVAEIHFLLRPDHRRALLAVADGLARVAPEPRQARVLALRLRLPGDLGHAFADARGSLGGRIAGQQHVALGLGQRPVAVGDGGVERRFGLARRPFRGRRLRRGLLGHPLLAVAAGAGDHGQRQQPARRQLRDPHSASVPSPSAWRFSAAAIVASTEPVVIGW